ncbi:MAG: C10 family peptidase, partial [Lentisphaeria bacterium]|nr:C10 family peptidase [Lentisphaeria bacterium]
PVQIRINDVIMVDKTIASIPRGGVRSYHFGTYGFDPGEYTISLVMDPYDEIAESDESNNVFSYTFTVPGNQDWLIKPKWTSFENLFGTDILLNEYSPIDPDTGEKCGAGCGNVARTQILAYFASLGNGFTVELTEEDAFLFDGKIAIDGTEENAKANGTISFAEVNRLLEDFDETSAEDVAALCYASAAIIGNGGSNARLFKRIGFKSTTTVYRGKSDLWSADGNLSDKAWEMLIRNVENGQPVITGVPDPHVIIIDGYDAATDMVHINFDFGIANGKRYVEKFGVMRGNGWYTRDELDALELQYFHYDITPDTEKPLAGQVACRISGTCAELSLDFTDDVGVWKKYYRLAGSDEWLEYTDKVTVQYNTTVYFKACDKGKNDSAVTTYTVTGLADPPPVTISGNSQGVSWTSATDAQKYTVEYSRDNFANIQRFEANTTAVDTYAMPAGTYRWRVKADDGDFVSGSAFTAGKAAAAQKYTSDADGDLDVFFGNADGVWGNGYAAEHQGILNGWKGTGEQIILDGKNRIADVFAGSTDANILVLTDDANGDALFVDDIFTTLGDQARLSQIDEIRAGFGDDIVDMTSQQFTYSGDGVIIYGGSGNDTIWANRGANTLFGDAGNDRIVGGSSDDYIIGGAGNDAMLGGGGNDIFCFGGDWGCDTIEQLANGKVTLWFDEGSASNWNASTLTYTDGTNTVTVSGVTNITLKFGGEAPVNGAFSDAASEKIFEDKNKGMIA